MKQLMIKIEEEKIKGVEKIETIYPETVELPTYDYGNSQNTLDYNIALRNKPTGGGGLFMGQFTISSTGNKVITGIGFKPKMVKFSFGNTTNGAGRGGMTDTYQYAFDLISRTSIYSQCIYFRDGSSNVVARAVYVSLDTDGFTVNCTYYASTAYVTYECYG